MLELDKEYIGHEIGHFRAFTRLHLKEHEDGLLFGSADNAQRLHAKNREQLTPSDLGNDAGICGMQWICSSPLDNEHRIGFTSIGLERVKYVRLRYSQDEFIRLGPRLRLGD